MNSSTTPTLRSPAPWSQAQMEEPIALLRDALHDAMFVAGEDAAHHWAVALTIGLSREHGLAIAIALCVQLVARTADLPHLEAVRRAAQDVITAAGDPKPGNLTIPFWRTL